MGKTNQIHLDSAHRSIGEAMLYAIGFWFVPFLSGVACNVFEKKLITGVLQIMGRDGNATKSDEVFWFVRKKMLLVNMATYVPYAGTALQVMEVYAMGQFAIQCSDLENLSDDEMQLAWGGVEREMLSGRNLIAFYEGFSGKLFPQNLREPFENSIDEFSQAYRWLMRVRGVTWSQEKAGQGIRIVIHAAVGAFEKVKGKVKWRPFAGDA